MSEQKWYPVSIFKRTDTDGYPEIVISSANDCPLAVVSGHREYTEFAVRAADCLNKLAGHPNIDEVEVVSKVELEKLRKDAMRYSFLRDNAMTIFCANDDVAEGNFKWGCADPRSLDSYIDAAIAGAKQ